MDQKHLGMALIVFSVLIMVFAQLMLKNRLNIHGAIPLKIIDLYPYFMILVRDVLVWAGGIGLVVSALAWYMAVSRVPLSFAFPFAAMSYPLIFITSVLLLGEQFSYTKLLANTLIVSGVLLIGFSNTQ